MSLKQLISAIKAGDNQLITLVLNYMKEENVNEKDENGCTALHKACWLKNNQAVSLLLAKPGINVNAKNRLGQTPLRVACWRNNHFAVDQLLRCPGIDENVKDNDGRTPIMMAAEGCSMEALAVMLKSERVNLDVKDNRGWGLENCVGYWEGGTEKCLDMIREERIKRKTVPGNEKQVSGEESLKIDIEKIEGVSKKIEDCEQRWKEKVSSRKLKMRELDQKHSSEMEMLAKRQKNEKSALQESFHREDDDYERYMASLEEIRKDLAQDIEKKTTAPSNNDVSKLEAARDTLECPVCMETMKPPTRIWMCRSSHAICETCKDQLEKGGPYPPCPTCKSERVDQRALLAEKFAASVFNA